MTPDPRQPLRLPQRKRLYPARPDRPVPDARIRDFVAKIPKFFCEFCGTQVKQNDKVCSHCGKFFSSVKCPSCGFIGDSRIFRDGCPACGYAIAGNSGSGSSGKRAGRGKAPRWPKTNAQDQGAKDTPDATDPLPWWVYLASMLLLAGILALILLQR